MQEGKEISSHPNSQTLKDGAGLDRLALMLSLPSHIPLLPETVSKANQNWPIPQPDFHPIPLL